MKKQLSILIIFLIIISVQSIFAQRGYYNAPYKRYEADIASLSNGAVITPKSYAQTDLQSEASDQVCVDMNSENAAIEFTLLESADGLVIRYSVPDGDSAVIGVYEGDVKITNLTLTSKWSWEYLWNNGDPNNVGVKNKNPRMRFDEVRYKLPNKISNLKLIKESGNTWIDFIEMEVVPEEVTPPEDAVVFNGDGSSLQQFIDANGSKTIFIPAGVYNINSQLYIGVAKTKLQGAGMWYTQLNFTVTNASNGGLRANAKEVSYADLFITSEMTTRTNGYAGIHGVYTPGSTIRNVWVEHCATGAWIGQYVSSGPEFADGLIISDCRFRNTFADGINLCKGTRNTIVEHCNFRNNGDDGMAIWSAEGLECINNTYRNNTIENGWRAAGAALYGGKDNKFYDLVIKDIVDVGITIANLFQGVGFNENGMHDFHNITITGCGTFNAIYNDRVGAINITHAASAGSKVQNIRLYNININDSKCDAIRIAKNSGEGIFNLSFENVNINGTGLEYPSNNVNNSGSKRGYAIYFDTYPLGSASYCSLNYSNLGGNSEGVAFGNSFIGNFKWEEVSNCESSAVKGISLSPADTSIAGGANIQLIPIFSPENATNKIVSYTSSNPEVAFVDYNGFVTALSKGNTTITVVTQDGHYEAAANINVTSDPLVYYKIKNRWQNTYLYDAGDRVKYSLSSSGNAYLWKIDNVEGITEIMNISTGDFMHIENLLDYVECTKPTSGSLGSSWSLENAGDGFVRIKSEWNTTDYIQIENLLNLAQYGPVESSWWSAMWELEPVIIVTSSVGIPLERKAEIFPNPSNGEFNFTMNDCAPNENVSITIFNLAGQAIYSSLCTVNSKGLLKLTVNSHYVLSPGNYYILAKGNSTFAKAKLLITNK